MRAFDLGRLDSGSSIEVDICIIGSGAAGMTLASELEGMRVLVIEGGGVDPEQSSQSLYDIESTGDPRNLDQSLIRARVLGGSTHIWSGRCAPFDPIDYQKRDWIAGSGWPIAPDEINRYLDRASAYLNLHPAYESLWPQLAKSGRKPLDSDKVQDRLWQASQDAVGRPMDFGRQYGPDADLLLHANVVRIADHVVEVATLDGKSATITAKAIILCAGGVENARLLLASGLGNDNVGRFLMDHIDCPIGVFDKRGVENVFGHYWLDTGGRRHIYDYGMRLSPDIQRQEKILNCHAFLLNFDDGTNGWSAFTRLARTRRPRPGLKQDLLHTVGGMGDIASAIYRRRVLGRPFQPGRLEWHLMLEQAPNRESRITLSDARDSLGIRRASLHWQVGELELRTAERAQEIFEAELKRLGLPVPRRLPLGSDWIKRTSEKAHPTGTTRMAASPLDGVVDENCQVFGHKGLYVAGSSVFPTAGAANPTLMIVAASIRLAEHLKAEFGGTPKSAVPLNLRARYSCKSGGTRVGFIGASKRVCEMHLPVVEYLGYEVVGFTARSNASAYRLESRSGAPRFDTAAELAKECDLLIVAVSDDLSEHIVPNLMPLNVALLCETPLAWTADGVRRVLSHQHVKLGVAEQFPFLPIEQLRQKILPQLGVIQSAINDGAVYKYHGIAQLRRYMTGSPNVVRGDTVHYDSGQTLVHRDHSARPSLRIVGSTGEMVDEVLTLAGKTHHVVREADGSVSLAGERWQNPYPGLSDEQIAVATLIEAMRSKPLYSGLDFLTDIELVQALHYAGSGSRIDLPLNARSAKWKRITSPGFLMNLVR